MKKILFIVYYELKEYLASIKEQFEKFNMVMIHYPLFKFAYDSNDKIKNYNEHLNNFIKENEPDIILWWFIDVPYDIFKYIKDNNKDILYIMYNVDDPINLSKDIFDKASLFDIIITPCKDSIHKYKLYSKVKKVIFGIFGYDPSVFYPIDNINDYTSEYNEYTNDISIVIHNLFTDQELYKYQYINSIELINNVIKYSNENNKKFKIYGSPIIKEYFPDNYGGNPQYHNINFIYNFSKINLSLHAFSNKSLSTNEHIMSILGSSGLLMIDHIKDLDNLLKNNYECIYIEKDNYIQQIDNILKNYDIHNDIKKNGKLVSNKYSWYEWTKKIVIEIGILDFNPKLYKLLHNLDDIPDNNLIEYWKTIGIEKNDVCYNFKIPPNFNYEQYIIDNSLQIKDQSFAYYHWYKTSKKDIYMKNKEKNNNINLIECGVSPNQYIKILNLLNKIYNNESKDKSLLKLGCICQLENIDINKIINNYFDIV
jgi:hypothetical protein